MTASAANGQPSKWRSEHIWKIPDWVEPIIIITILLSAMFMTRRRHYSIFHSHYQHTSHRSHRYHLQVDSPDSMPLRISTDSNTFKPMLSGSPPAPGSRHPSKSRRLFSLWTVHTPNSSRFARHIHSCILVKFPFLVEMFYWVINLVFYRMTAVLAQVNYGGAKPLWEAAERHGKTILEAETYLLGTSAVTTTQRFPEWRIQHWFLTGADGGDFRGAWLNILDRGYSLIHIPGTVGFIAFYYWYAPTFNRFATVRRTMSLLNLLAFLIFLFYPTMPPRFLPAEYDFVDTVNAEDAQSVWMSGKFVNRLAAMPSMHFGYAFCIGCVFVLESGFIQQHFSRGKIHFLFDKDEADGSDGPSYCAPSERIPAIVCDDQGSDAASEMLAPIIPPAVLARQRSIAERAAFFILGVFYPSWILLTIVATGNHYFMDALVAAICVLVAAVCNRLLLNFLILEDWLLWAWRLEKPRPTTGWRRRKAESCE